MRGATISSLEQCAPLKWYTTRRRARAVITAAPLIYPETNSTGAILSGTADGFSSPQRGAGTWQEAIRRGCVLPGDFIGTHARKPRRNPSAAHCRGRPRVMLMSGGCTTTPLFCSRVVEIGKKTTEKKKKTSSLLLLTLKGDIDLFMRQ